MDTINLTTREALIYGTLILAGIGFVLGLIPLGFGFFNGKLKLGLIAILATTIGGAVLGLFFSVPAAVIFTWLVIRASKSKAAPLAVETDSENN